MGNTYVISGLRDKRARLAGEIAAAEAKLAAKRETLANLDAVIRLFSPQTDPELIAPVRPFSKHGLFFRRGEATRLCFNAMREAGKPVPTHQVTAWVVAAKRYDDAEGKVKAAIVLQIRQALVRMEQRGQVRKVLVGPECWSLGVKESVRQRLKIESQPVKFLILKIFYLERIRMQP